MRYVLASALVFAMVLLSGFATVNIFHNLKVPSFDSAKVTSYSQVDTTFPFVHKVISVRLNDTIKGVNAYKDVAEAISELGAGDTVKIYLSGYGGDVQGAIYVINAIKDTKATTETYIVGPVYSAHAYIALYGDKIIMDVNSFVMLHSSSVFEVDCSQQVGTDRGITKEESCENYKKFNLISNRILLIQSDKLSTEEINYIMSGHEIYLNPLQMAERGAVLK